MASQKGLASALWNILRNAVDIFGDGSAFANETATRNANQKGIATTTTVTTSGSTGTLLAANPKRLSAEFINRDTAITVYLSGTASATTDLIPLAPGAQYVDNFSNSIWKVIATSGTPKVCVTEYALP